MIGPLWTFIQIVKSTQEKKLLMQEFYYACKNLYM